MSESPTTGNTAHRHCSVARALDIMGDAWSFLVLREPFFHVYRFDAIQGYLGVARNVLAARLNHLVDHGVLERARYLERPPRYDYRLTEKGLALYPALLAMIRWADTWEAGAEGPPLVFTHKVCGKRFSARVVCGSCDGELDVRSVSYRDGPGAGATPPNGGRRIRRASKPDSYERGRACSVARMLKVMGDQWTYLLLREVFFGVYRFDKLRANLGIARNILTDRLRRLQDTGVLERRQYMDRPARFEYRLTEKGRDLYGSVLALMAWGDEWLGDGGGRPLVLTHNSCGRDFTPKVVCSECRGEIHAREVVFEPGPGARELQAA